MNFDPQDRKQIAYQPPLITRNRGESMVEYYLRAEKIGVARKCITCGTIYRFSELRCPECGERGHSHTKTSHKIKDEELAPSGEQSIEYHAVVANETGLESKSQFTPVGEPASDPDAKPVSVSVPSVPKPETSPSSVLGSEEPERAITEFTRAELASKITDLGGKVTSKDNKETLVKKYNALVAPEMPENN